MGGVKANKRTINNDYSYKNNPQYEAFLTMFELNKQETDVIFAGDSITSNCRFSEFFPEINLLNRGIGSDTVEGLFNRIGEISMHNPKKVFILIGINDISLGIPQDESLKWYQMSIEFLRDNNPDCEVYVVSVLPTNTVELCDISRFNIALQRICDETQTVYIDLWNYYFVDDESLNSKLFSTDGVHLNGYGYKVLCETYGIYL